MNIKTGYAVLAGLGLFGAGVGVGRYTYGKADEIKLNLEKKKKDAEAERMAAVMASVIRHINEAGGIDGKTVTVPPGTTYSATAGAK